MGKDGWILQSMKQQSYNTPYIEVIQMTWCNNAPQLTCKFIEVSFQHVNGDFLTIFSRVGCRVPYNNILKVVCRVLPKLHYFECSVAVV